MSAMLAYALLSLTVGLVCARFTGEPFRPEWRPVYTVEGTIYIPRNEIKEPFKAWFDSFEHLSRIDYYDGTVQTYQKGNSGTLLKIVPYTDDKVLNQRQCLAASNQYVKPQTVLPDVTDFKLIGSENLNDVEAWKWQLEVVIQDMRFQYTLWVNYKENEESVKSIPMKYEVHTYNTSRGTQQDYFYLDYTHYNDEILGTDVFDTRAYTCNSIGKYAQINPMENFMGQVHLQNIRKQFEQFKKEHGRQYASDLEHEERMNIFHQNLRYIESHNRAGHRFTLAVNHLADRTPEELVAMSGVGTADSNDLDRQGLPFPYTEAEIEALSVELPEDFDWRPYGAVTPVKAQMTCGSCWAFAAVGAVEGALFLHSGQKELVRLSEQALVDCSWGFGNNGCGGGWTGKAFSWVTKHGLPTYEAYGGYLGLEGNCHILNMTKTTFIKGWVDVTRYNEEALQLAIFKHGPVAVSIDSSPQSFFFYSHGVYYNSKCDSEEFNHYVLAVGYGVLHGEKYWLIKNSWGPQWGMDGYMLISTKNNNCGVMTRPSYVLMSK